MQLTAILRSRSCWSCTKRLTDKTLRVMKLTAILLTVACLQVAAKGKAQTVTLDLTNAPVQKVFREVSRQTGVSIVYAESLFKNAQTVTIRVKEASVQDVLDRCLKGLPFGYTLKGTTIVISEKTTVVQPADNSLNLPPPIDVKGKIVDENGKPVLATVTVKGTSKATSTNENGEFFLTGVDETATLIISGVSIETYEVKVNGKTEITINAITRVTAQEEVVINAGYYDVKKRKATGNISKVSGKDIENNPVSNPLAALQARVPGLEIIQTTGVPGGSFTIRLRGQNSIANGNDPLIIIDGVPYTNESTSSVYNSQNLFFNGTSPLNNINIGDIESIEILKDADATAIYGSRGANGVILITTKRGNPGLTKVNATYYGGIGKVSSKIDLLNTQQYLEMRKEAFVNEGVTPTFSSGRDILYWNQDDYTNWQDYLIGGSAHYNDAQVSISGGEKSTQFNFGSGFHKETSVFPGNNASSRISTHLNVNNSSQSQKLKSSITLNYSASNTNFISKDLTDEALVIPPNAPKLFKPNGDLNWNDTTGYSASFSNPLAYLQRPYSAQTNNLNGNLIISYSLNSNLEIKSNFGYTNITSNSVTKNPKKSYAPSVAATRLNESIFADNNFQNWIVEPQINWHFRLNESEFNILVGTSFLEQETNSLAQAGTGFVTEALMDNLKAAPNIFIYADTYSQYRYSAIFGRINYQLKDKYVVNLTGRRDGSSRFGPGKQFAMFGAFGGAWIFSKEDFIAKIAPILSFGKLRVSYGIAGNDQLGDYSYLDTYTSSPVYFNTPGLTPVRLSNPDFAWETNRKFEAGIELGLFRDRVQIEASFYKNRSSNQLVGFALPPTTGFTSIQGNLPAIVQNSGIEIEFTSQNIKKNDFSWTSSINVSVPRNKLIAFPDLEKSPNYSNALVIGKALSIIKRYNYLGVNPQTGFYQVEDVNADGVINTNDRVKIQFVGRYCNLGFSNSLQFKGFQVDILLQYMNQVAGNYLRKWGPPGLVLSNQPAEVMQRWRNIGDLSDMQKFALSSANVPYSTFQGTEESSSDASFLRLKNLNVSYKLPDGVVKKTRLHSSVIFIQGQNLFTITNYKGLDPETGNFSLPPLKVLTMGIKITL